MEKSVWCKNLAPKPNPTETSPLRNSCRRCFGRSDKSLVMKNNKTPFSPHCHFDRNAEERSMEWRNLFGVKISLLNQIRRRLLHSATPAVVASVEVTKFLLFIEDSSQNLRTGFNRPAFGGQARSARHACGGTTGREAQRSQGWGLAQD